jgi:hypothetical protein
VGVLGMVDDCQLAEGRLQRLALELAAGLQHLAINQGAKIDNAPPSGAAILIMASSVGQTSWSNATRI